MSNYQKQLPYVPEGQCNVPWFAAYSLRHYCDSAAIGEVVIDENPYLACRVCLADLFINKVLSEVRAA